MFSNIFSKTLYEKRWTMFWGFIAAGMLALLTGLVFLKFKEPLDAALQDFPGPLRDLIGEAVDYQIFTPYIDVQVVNQLVFLVVILAVFIGTELLAGDESEGRLQVLLVQPVSRSSVYMQKFAACAVVVASACVGLFAGTMTGAALIGESLDVGRFALACLAIWLIGMVFASLAYALGAITARRTLSGVTAGAVATITYIITALAGHISGLSILNVLSPFAYFNHPSILRTGGQPLDLLILVAISVLLVLIGWVIFRRRDVGRW